MAKTTYAHSEVAGKALTPRETKFAEWLGANTGVEVDPQSVALAVRLSGTFSKDPALQAERDAAKAAREAEKAGAAARQQEKREARAAKLEAEAAAIRDGSKRGPGRPPKSETVTAPEPEDAELVGPDDEEFEVPDEDDTETTIEAGDEDPDDF